MKQRYWFSASPGEFREEHLRWGFEILVRLLGPQSTKFVCYGWQGSHVRHQDSTANEIISALGALISWQRSAPEFSRNGFAAGGNVSPEMIEALLQAPAELGPSPVFTLKFFEEGSDAPIFECGDYSDILFRLEESEIGDLRELFDEAKVPFLVQRSDIERVLSEEEIRELYK